MTLLYHRRIMYASVFEWIWQKNIALSMLSTILTVKKCLRSATPEIEANNIEANLVHEAAIGKIAGEQLTKLMTLGLTEKEAEDAIINGFLK